MSFSKRCRLRIASWSPALALSIKAPRFSLVTSIALPLRRIEVAPARRRAGLGGLNHRGPCRVPHSSLSPDRGASYKDLPRAKYPDDRLLRPESLLNRGRRKVWV